MSLSAPPDPTGPGQASPQPWRLALCLALGGATWFVAPGPGPLRFGLALFVLVAALWMTQALPLAATALLVPLLSVLSGLQQPQAALAPFSHPIIFLFLGGFALAAALRRQGLARALADAVLRAAQGRRSVAVLLLAATTALTSMWMSNTAAAVLMLPLAIGLLDAQREAMGPQEQSFTLLALTYSTAIGGMASIISTPPNAMAAAHSGAGFAQWFLLVAPLSLTLWVLMLGVLYLTLRPRLAGRVEIEAEAIVWTRQRVITATIFAGAVVGWVGGGSLGRLLGIEADMHAVVALAALGALVATGVIGWDELEHDVQWSVLLLFGGGLALSEVMTVSAASSFLVERLLALVQGAPRALVMLGVIAFIVLLSELMSNTASAALALPLFMPLAPAVGVSPVAMAAAIALAASCGFMLPVATPPNALVFGTGRVTQGTMMRCGWKLDIVCITGITVAAQWLWA
ncbi:MAG TPA: DASS family sodium-coupled anion symporter [Ramlibacter sp.]|nr:DASS family sodium-coupled anion symporter [Ramlibacter sp.]